MIYFKLYLISWLQFYRYVTFQEFVWNGYVLSVIVFLASVLQHSFFQNHHFIVIREGIRLRSAIQVRQTLVNECLTTPPAQNNILANWCWRRSSDRSFSVDYFPFQPVVHNWFIKGCGMYCSVYGKVHIKDPLLLIEKSSLCGGSGFPSKKCVNVTIWMTSNNRW